MTQQLALFETETAERWLARKVITAHELCLIHLGDLDGARSSIVASCRGAYLADCSYEVRAGKVGYRHPVHGAGEMTVRSLVRVAADAHDPAVGEALCGAYRAYVEATTGSGWKPCQTLAERQAENERRRPAYRAASSALDAAAAAWWTGVAA